MTNAKTNVLKFVAEESTGDNAESLLQIMLIRHGEPDLGKPKWVNRRQAIDYISQYDRVGIIAFRDMPVEILDGEIKTVYTSNLARAKHTARLLFGERVEYQANPLFREFERRIINFPNWKLPLRFWKLTSRIIWLLGGNSSDIESFREARQRSKLATDELERLAKRDKKVILVAHGFLNLQLIHNLKKRGWILQSNGGRKYLAASLLIKPQSD